MNDSRANIRIQNLEVMGSVGVTDSERERPQRLLLNITLYPVLPFQQLGDDIESAVNYSAVAVEAHKIVSDRSDKLIETLADQIARRLIDMFPISEAVVEVKKFVLSDAEYVSVTAVRSSRA